MTSFFNGKLEAKSSAESEVEQVGNSHCRCNAACRGNEEWFRGSAEGTAEVTQYDWTVGPLGSSRGFLHQQCHAHIKQVASSVHREVENLLDSADRR